MEVDSRTLNLESILIDFGDGSAGTLYDATDSLAHNYQEQGYYSIQYTLYTNDGDVFYLCGSAGIPDQPDFNLNAEVYTCEDPILIDPGIVGASYSWPDENQSNHFIITDPGYYTLAAQNQCGSEEIIIEAIFGECMVSVPNVFTPNGDHSNDFFTIPELEGHEWRCVILNRWGNVVAQLDNLNSYWDGKTKAGLECHEGVYFYRLEYDGNVQSGAVTLVRLN